MAIIKCKMCGGDLNIIEGASTAECEFCGSVQTLPKANDEVIQNLFNRANNLRIKCEFDKAEQIYEKILHENDAEAEAHWGIVLCKYGIEYVEDPKTFKRIPTCHRTSYDAVTTDTDYLAAIEHADAVQKGIYEAEAKAIDAIQKDILNIVKNEKPFDVFICYKETDEDGKRTQDSVIANDIYYQLTQEGFKVFYAAITLEDKLGQEYEPYIFAALNSAKVMLVIGTKPQYFSAVWVKNEWSRFLKLMKSDRTKLLIPCYKDMDAYDLPEEFSHLQAQDMSKLGFMQDLIRGIKKIAQADTPKTTVVKETVITGGNNNTAPLLERAFMFLEDGDWDSANEYCEKVLDIDPKNAQAYLGKLMAEIHVRKQDSLQDQAAPFDGYSNYQKAIRFADDSLRKALTGYIEFINNRNEHDRLEGIYNKATRQKRAAITEEEYKAAATTYGTIATYRDADALKQECLELAENARKNAIYNKAKSLFSRRSIPDIEQAINQFKTIPSWKDADEKVIECQQKIERIKQEDEEKRIQDEKEKKIRTKKMIIGSSIGAAIVAVLIVLFTVIIPTINYNKADALLAAGDYEAAMEGFRELNYKDSYEKYCTAFTGLKDSYRETAAQYIENGDMINAAIWYRKAGDIDQANAIYNIESLVYTGGYISAGIMVDGTLRYQSNHEYDQGGAQENLEGITGFLRNTGSIVGVDNNGYLLTHDAGGFGITQILEEVSVESYNGIVSVISGISSPYDDYVYYVVMLLSDGSVAEAKESGGDPYPDVKNWKDIKSIQAGYDCIFGIDINGKVYQAKETGGNPTHYNLTGLNNVLRLIEFYGNLIVLTEDGKLSVLGDTSYYTDVVSEKSNVHDIVECQDGILVLYEDGKVEWIIAPSDSAEYAETINGFYGEIATELGKWNGIVSIQAGASGIIGIRYDGTVNYVSTDIYYYNPYGSSYYRYNSHETFNNEIEAWSDIVFISETPFTSVHARGRGDDWAYAIGIKYDGTAVSTGDGRYYTYEEYGEDYRAVSHDGGTYHVVSDWKLW